jgi:hypothetical protein
MPTGIRLALAVLVPLSCGCAARWNPLGSAPPYHFRAAAAGDPQEPAQTDPFRADEKPAGLSEEAVGKLLEQAVPLDPAQRLGILPASVGWAPSLGYAAHVVPAEITRALDGVGLFRTATELSADWPSARGVSGLRELGLRYRTPYLLLYRLRFADEEYANAWSLLLPTVIGYLLAPVKTVETHGVAEAALFDVRTGTVLFTVFEQIDERADTGTIGAERRLRTLKEQAIAAAAVKLAAQVADKTRRLTELGHATASAPAG